MSSLRWTAVLGGIGVVVAAASLAAACGGSSPATCDPATDPGCSSGGDASSVPDGITMLPDGAWLLPDGAVVPGLVGIPGCTSDGLACTSSATCCGGRCDAGKCTPLSPTCKTLGNTCAGGGECCSTFCDKGVCANPSYCIQTGDACTSASTCCSGTCNIAAGAPAGTCGPVPTGATYCKGVDGTVCSDCTDCCSRVCAPYALTGVNICQPAEGCHVVGNLCRRDLDCCGAKGTGLPGDGNVTCEIAPGATIGICRNPLSCNPEGAVCHYKSAAVCGTSAARADCCDGLGAKSGVCRPDALGVPRCYGGEPCHKVGEACADSSGCCDGTPCVPDASGVLRCTATKCVPKAGACTVDADCCVGTTCHVALGSTTGTCDALVPPPPPPTDAGTDGSTTDASTTDTTPPPTCSLYGQSCSADGDCCSGVPCISPAGVACAGASGCTCRNVIR